MIIDNAIKKSAQIAVRDVLALKAGEEVLIVTNPDAALQEISFALFEGAAACGAKPVIVTQEDKSILDFAENAVTAAIASKPQVVISISAKKLGKDAKGIAEPYQHEGKSYDSLLHLMLHGEKSCRSFWSPGISADSFLRTVPIDYALLKQRCSAIGKVLSAASSVHVTSPGGTDIRIGLAGREAKQDDGDFSTPGSGGNLPAGETFISPENGTAEGVIVFDGSISLSDGELLVQTPVRCVVKGGFVRDITGGTEAAALLACIKEAEQRAHDYERDGKLASGKGDSYAKNARHLGEFGIGLNPEARVTGNMLEDEKAFRTCHFAIGSNYDDDAEALIHLDCLVHRPTIAALMPDGKEIIIEDNGELKI